MKLDSMLAINREEIGVESGSGYISALGSGAKSLKLSDVSRADCSVTTKQNLPVF